MNASRLSDIRETAELLHQLLEEVAIWSDSAAMLAENMELLRDEEQGAYENIPTNFKESKRALVSIEVIDELRSAVNNMDHAVQYIENALQDMSNILSE